jgi:DNA-binding CsgD family transcriptional regulator
MTSETVLVSRRDLLLVLPDAQPGRGSTHDEALRRLQLAARYEPVRSADVVVARFSGRRETQERDERIARLSRERLTDTEISIREGVSPQTVRRAKTRVMTRKNLDGIRESFFGDLDAVLYGAWQIVHDPPPRVSQTGKPVTTKVTDPDTGEITEVPVPDMERVISALDLARKTIADQRALIGADAPKRTISAKLDLRQQAEEQWKELFGQQENQRAISAEVVTDELSAGLPELRQDRGSVHRGLRDRPDRSTSTQVQGMPGRMLGH